jgi:hypothetical protein
MTQDAWNKCAHGGCDSTRAGVARFCASHLAESIRSQEHYERQAHVALGRMFGHDLDQPQEVEPESGVLDVVSPPLPAPQVTRESIGGATSPGSGCVPGTLATLDPPEECQRVLISSRLEELGGSGSEHCISVEQPHSLPWKYIEIFGFRLWIPAADRSADYDAVGLKTVVHLGCTQVGDSNSVVGTPGSEYIGMFKLAGRVNLSFYNPVFVTLINLHPSRRPGVVVVVEGRGRRDAYYH